MCDSCHYSNSSSEGSDSNSEHSGSESEESQEESCPGGSCSRGGNAMRQGRPRRGNGSGGSSCGRRSGVKDIASSFCLLGKARPRSGSLPFDPAAIQDIILKLSDMFDMRVNMTRSQIKNAVIITSGLALAGSVIGKSFGGNMGAAIGGAVGGACGVGYTLVSLRDVWDEVWWELSELFDITYDFLGGLGFEDYQSAMKFLLSDNKGADLVKLLAEVASSALGKSVIPALLPQ